MAIGQYDTYTPIEIFQYVNTIANNGIRVSPSLMKKIVNGNEPFVPQPYNPPMPDSQPASDEEISQPIAESEPLYLPEMIGGVDVNTSY